MPVAVWGPHGSLIKSLQLSYKLGTGKIIISLLQMRKQAQIGVATSLEPYS